MKKGVKVLGLIAVLIVIGSLFTGIVSTEVIVADVNKDIAATNVNVTPTSPKGDLELVRGDDETDTSTKNKTERIKVTPIPISKPTLKPRPTPRPKPTPTSTHDMVVTNVNTTPSSPDLEQPTVIYVTVTNEGEQQEDNVSVKVYVDSAQIGSTQYISSAPGSSNTTTFLWSPTTAKTYSVKGEVEILNGEINVKDNTKSIKVWVSAVSTPTPTPTPTPTAIIDSITTDPAEQGTDTVSFTGHGTDPDGTVEAYNWSSSIDGQLSTSVAFTKQASELSVGTHTIYFKVQDDDGTWSTEDTEDLTIYPGPELSYSPESHEFGDMREGETDNTTFELWNSGTDTLTYSLRETCDWLEVHPTSGSSTGEHNSITVDMDTTGLFEGSHTGDITINSNDGSRTFTVMVNVMPCHCGNKGVNPTSWSTTLNCGESDNEVVTVSASDGTVKGVTVSKISGPTWLSVSPTNLGNIASGSNKTFTMTAAPPSETSGDFGYTVTVSNTCGTPSTRAVSGTIHVSCPCGNMSVNLTSWSPTLNCSESDNEVVTVSATGGTVKGVTVSKVSGPTWLSVSQTDLGDIASGSNKTFTMTVAPPSETSGDFTYTVRVSSTCGSQSSIDVPGTIHVDCPESSWRYRVCTWTYMVYLDGDNNLEGAGIDDFLEMSSVGSTSDVNIVVQFDRIPGDDTSYGDWTDCKRFHVTSGMTPTAANALIDLGECNMGDPNTLRDFMDWAMTEFPADNYALILWNHGDGWKSINKWVPWADDLKDAKDAGLSRGICVDNTNNDYLSLQETEVALTGKYVQLLGYDACLMHMIEVVYQVMANAGVSVGSEEVEPWDGWPYDTILNDLTGMPTMNEDALGTVIVDRYMDSYGYTGSQTQSAVDNLELPNLVTAVDNLAQALMTEINAGHWTQVQEARSAAEEIHYNYYIDLYHFAEKIPLYVPGAAAQAQTVMDSMGIAVYAEAHGSWVPNDHGLSIYFPGVEGDYLASYDSTAFAVDTEWNEFLKRYYEGPELVCDGNATSCGIYPNCENCNDNDGCYLYGNGCEERDYYCTNNEEGCDYTYTNRHTDDWVDTGTTRWVDDPENECKEKEQKEQEYHDYTCSDGACIYTVTGTQWVDTGTKRNKPDGTICGCTASNTLKRCYSGVCTDTGICNSSICGADATCDGKEPGDSCGAGICDSNCKCGAVGEDYGVFRNGLWILPPNYRVNYGMSTDIPITGDWNGNGVDTIGVRRDRQWILSNSNAAPSVAYRVNWAMSTDIQITGDWDGDGVDTIGVRRGREWILSNSNTAPSVAIRVNYGMSTDIPVVGDWNGDGVDTIGVRRGGQWILSNSNVAPSVAYRVNYGMSTDTPVVGDWDGDGVDTIGVRRGRQWILSNSNAAPVVAYRFNYGMSTDIPVTGNWI